MKITIIATLVAILSGAALAAGIDDQDYAVAFDIRIEQSAPVYRIALDERVYRESISDRLEDMVVVDADGHAVAHAVRPTQPEPLGQTTLPLFALPDAAASGALTLDNDAVVVDLGDHGTIVRVRGKDATDAMIAAALPRAWLLDASAVDAAISALEFDWAASDEGDGFVATLLLERSDDLMAWQSVPVRGVLADLASDGRRIRHDRLDFAAVRANYLRLRFQHAAPISLGSVNASLQPRDRSPLTRTVRGRRIEAEDAVFWQFDLGGPLPLVSAAPGWTGQQVVFDARIETSALTPAETWHAMGEGTFYRLVPEGSDPLVSAPVALSGSAQRHLRLRLRGPAPTVTPALRLGLRRTDLYFLDAGRMPYRLLVGSASEEGPDRSALNRLLAMMQARDEIVATATLGAPRSVGGERARTPELPFDFAPVLWAALAAGVLLLAYMLHRLLREMRQTD